MGVALATAGSLGHCVRDARSLQDRGAGGKYAGSPRAWHDALAFRGRSPSVTKSAMHRLVCIVLNPLAVLWRSRSFRTLETCFRGYKKQHLRISIYLPSNSNIFLWIHLYVGLVLSNSVI